MNKFTAPSSISSHYTIKVKVRKRGAFFWYKESKEEWFLILLSKEDNEVIKYILQGIGMLVMPRGKNAIKNLHPEAAVEAKVLAAKTMERVWIDKATAWAKKTDFQDIYHLLEQNELDEVYISINSYRDVSWTIAPASDVIYYPALEDTRSMGPRIPGLQDLARWFSPGIDKTFSRLLTKHGESLTFIVGQDYVELKWVHQPHLREIAGEGGIVLLGNPVRTKVLKWYKDNRADVKKLMDIWGIVRLRGFITSYGVEAFVLEQEEVKGGAAQPSEALFQYKDSAKISGRGEFGKELAALFNECNIGELKKAIPSMVEIYEFEVGEYDSLDHTTADFSVEVLFPEA